MTSRVQGTGTFTPTRVWGTATFTSTTLAEYNATLASLLADTRDYTVTSTNVNQRKIMFAFDSPTPAPPDPAARYQSVVAAFPSLVAYTLINANPTTYTVTYSFDSNKGPL